MTLRPDVTGAVRAALTHLRLIRQPERSRYRWQLFTTGV